MAFAQDIKLRYTLLPLFQPIVSVQYCGSGELKLNHLHQLSDHLQQLKGIPLFLTAGTVPLNKKFVSIIPNKNKKRSCKIT